MIYHQTPIYVYTTGFFGDGTFGTLQAVIDGYETLQYETGFYKPGNFEITIMKPLNHAEKLIQGRMIQVGEDPKKVGYISEVETTLTKGGVYYMKVTGVEFWGILKRRQVVPQPGGYAFVSSGATPVETGLKQMISEQMGPDAATKRQIAFLLIKTDLGRGPDMEMSERYSNLLDAATRLLTSTACGLFASLNTSTSKLELDFYTGTDRSNTVIFSSSLDTLESAKYTKSEVALRNVAIVGGQGEGVARAIRTVYEDTEPEGFDRMEMFVDARDLSTNSSLDNRGIQKLQENRFTRYIDFDSLTYSRYVYGTNFFCGDMVTVRDFGIDQSSKIISVTEMHKHGDFDLSMTFDKDKAEITGQVGSIVETTVRQNAIF